MSDIFETPISRLHNQGLNAISGYMRDNGPWLIFKWLSLIFLKTHLKDTSLRLHLDSRKGSEKLADLYTWEDFHHIHCTARAFYTGAKLDAPVLGSLMILPAKTGMPLGDFDYADLYAAKTMLLRLGEIVFVAALMDSCAAFNLTKDLMSKITGFLSPLQAREVMSHFAFINMHLQDRPDFFSEFKPAENQYFITARHAPKVKMEHTQKEDFGKILYEYWGRVIEQMKVPGQSQIIDSIKDGRRRFLFDKDGVFIQNSI